MGSYYRDPVEPNQPIQVRTVRLIERDGAVMVERRADDGSRGLIGGTYEGDESVTEVLGLEIREESAPAGDPVRSEESLHLRFASHGDLRSLDPRPAHRAIIEAYLGGVARPVVA